MRTFFKAGQARDFAQRYTNSFGWATKEDGTRQLVRVHRVYEDHLILVNQFEETRKVPINSPVIFEFIPAVRGWHNTMTNGPMFFYRNPARQWARGINDANTKVKNFRLLPTGLTMDLLAGVAWGDYSFANTYPRALSRHFMIGKIGIYIYEREIGHHVRGVAHVRSWIVQEFRDLVNRNNLPFEVKTLE